MPYKKMSYEDWVAEGENRFGPHTEHWRFKCPICNYEHSIADYRAVGAPTPAAGLCCIGRWMPKDERRDHTLGFGMEGPCDYPGAGNFGINPIHVTAKNGEQYYYFEFGDPPTELKQ